MVINKSLWLNRLWLAALYLAGALLWGQFFNWGKIPFDYHDWAEVNAARLAYLRDAVIKGEIPLHANEIGHLKNLTDRVLAIPDFIVTPQAILMRWMDVGTFVLINTILLYSLAFWGLLWFRRESHLSPFVFSALVLIFNFNGHMVSHFGVGHITWWGNFLFPLFFVQVFRYLKGEQGWRWVTETALLLFFMFLQGGYHQYTWCLIFLGILGLVIWKRFLPVLIALIFTNLLTMVRLLPPALLLGKFDTEFLGGYPLPWQILQAMLVERLPQQAMPFQNFNSNLGYWEFDLYIGIAGFAFISLGILLWLINSFREKRFPYLIVPMVFLALFSVRNFYLIFTKLPIPLLSAERVTSRMISLPFSLAMILAAISLQAWLSTRTRPWMWNLVSMLGLAYLGYDLVRHTLHWQVMEAVHYFPVTPVDLSIKSLANHPDPPYTNVLLIGGIISLSTLIILLVLSWRDRRSEGATGTTSVQKSHHQFPP